MIENLTDIRRNLLKECGVIGWTFRADASVIPPAQQSVKIDTQPSEINNKEASLEEGSLNAETRSKIALNNQGTTADEVLNASAAKIDRQGLEDNSLNPSDLAHESDQGLQAEPHKTQKERSTAHFDGGDSTTIAPEEPAVDNMKIDDAHLEESLVSSPLVQIPAVTARTADIEQLTQVATEVAQCTQCAPLRDGQIRALGLGQEANPRVMIVLNPASMREINEEKLLGGRAGVMFSRMLGAIGIDETNGYFCHATSCGVIQNVGALEMAKRCRSHLQRKINAIQPNVVLALGEIAAQSVLTTSEPLERLRNETHTLDSGILVRASYHPFDLLDRPANKARAWQDIRCILPHLSASNN